MLLSRQGATIKISELTEQEKKLVNRELFVAPVTLNDDFPKKFKVFRRNDSHVVVPKYWALENLKRLPVTHEYGNIQSMNSIVNFTGALRKELKQVEAVETLLKQLRGVGGGILSLDTGFGKTVCSIYTACQLKVKTMILVHKKFLEEQFEETIKRFVPDAKISKVRGDSCDISGDFIIASIQTLLARKYDNFDGIGCLIVDECFPRRQLILTNKGNREIGVIYDAWKRGEDIEVQSFDELTKSFSFKKVTHAWEKTTEEPLIKISYSKSNLKCTPNHKLLTMSGWKQAREIVVGDLLISTYNPALTELAVSKGLNPDQYQIMLGSILGDGSISKSPGGRYRLKFVHGEKQEQYLRWKAHMFGIDTIHTHRGGYTTSLKYVCATKSIDLSNHIDVSNRKTCPQWVIDDLDWTALAIWYMDDGTIHQKAGSIKISSNAFDLDTNERIQEKLLRMGIISKVLQSREYYYISIGVESSFIFLTKIAPYIHKELLYKLECDKYPAGVFPYSGCHEWNNTFLCYGTLRVTKTEYMPKKKQKVYDLEVEDNHTFICSSHSLCGPVVHNCHHIAAESFSQTMFGISFKYIIGLSATPTRKDGLTRLLHWFMGTTAYEVRRTQQKNVFVKIVPFTHAEYKKPPPVNKRGDICYTSLITKICDIRDRTLFIAEETKKIADTGRYVLVLSHRRNHAIEIKDILVSLGIDAATYLGGDKTEPDAQVICATYHLASEGYDNPRLSGLVLATPSSDVVQACGRILRGGSGNDPVIIDVVDQYSLFLGQVAKRKTFYRKIGFNTGKDATPVSKIEEQLECMFIDED